MAEEKHTFIVEKKCPVCGKVSRVVKTKARLIVEKTDEDFCVHYKGFNPNYYKIWVCEHCGYATDEKNFLKKMPDSTRETMQEFLQKRHVGFQFQEERGLPDAVAAFKLAIFYADYLKESIAHRAGLHLQIAWLFRESGEAEQEKAFMEKAAELYADSLSRERYPIGNMTDNFVMFLIGAIYYRLKDYDKATQYISRLMSDNEVRTNDRQTYDKARDLWQTIREEKEGKA